MDAIKGIGQFLGQVVFAAGLTIFGAVIFMVLLISLGGEPLLNSEVGGTMFGMAIVAGFFAMLHATRN